METAWYLRVISGIGLLTMVGIAFLLSNNKKRINWRTIITGIALQIIFGLLILKTGPGRAVFDAAQDLFNAILGYTAQGSGFVFGDLANAQKSGFVFATMTLPTIIFMSTLMAVLYHCGIMQKVIKGVAWVMMKTMRTSGAESLSCAANIFVGQTEAPLVVKPYVSSMTKSELMATMTGGMATVAGGVLAAYVGFGIDAGHLLSASVMAAPAALVLSKLMVPETEESCTAGEVKMKFEKTASTVIEAAANGASEGLGLALNVAGMLIGFIAMIALINGAIGWIGSLFGMDYLSLEWIFGYIFAPAAFIIGVPFDDCTMFGTLVGKKVVINEFVAYLDLKAMISGEILGAGGHQLSQRAIVMATYALCGFANFSSVAIQLGGIGGIAPNRRSDIAKLGIKALIGGILAGLMTASIAGMFV